MQTGKLRRSVLTLLLALTVSACGGTSASSASAPAASSEIQVVSSSDQASASDGTQLDLTDLKGLGETYLFPVVFSAATLHAWTDANSIPADQLVDMYGYMKIWNAEIPESEMELEGETPFYYLDESVLETYVQDYFAVSIEHLRSSDRYHADRKAYAFDMSGVGFSYAPSVTRAEYDESTHILTLVLDNGYEDMDEISEVQIQIMDDNRFQYVGNIFH